MKPLKGYRDVTRWVVSQVCDWEGCVHEGVYCSAVEGESIWNKPLYCKTHVILAAAQEEEKEKK